MIDLLQANWLTLLFVVGSVAAFVLLRNRPTDVESADQIVGNGQPVVVEVFSNT